MSIRFEFRHLDGVSAKDLTDNVTGIYREVYYDSDDPVTDEPAFRSRYGHAVTQEGFDLLLAESDSLVVGYAYGYTLPAGSRLWEPMQDNLSADFTNETGRRTFFIQELMVRESWRGKRLGRRLHDGLLAPRREERAVLFVLPDNDLVKGSYRRWGWHKVADVRFSPDAKQLECMVKQLHPQQVGNPGQPHDRF